MLKIPFAELPSDFRTRALQWAAGFVHCAYFEHNEMQQAAPGYFERLLAVSAAATPATTLANLAELDKSQNPDAPFCGFITYDAKNEIEALTSSNFDGFDWPVLHFFHPETWLRWQADCVIIESNTNDVLAAILATEPLADATNSAPVLPALQARMPRPDYLQAVEQVREEILKGEVYELTLCQEFYAENVVIDPIATFWKLNAASPAPFAGFVRYHSHYLLCASPERFISHYEGIITSQPIKGTRRRGLTPTDDEAQRLALLHDEKERAENLMIVDLVRNDLARVAKTGSVRVPELFGTYGFRNVWQMISTVEADLRPGVDLADCLRAAFPMGSMTGAPKIRAMQLIEHYERSRRGLYSGSIGYGWPNGDFEFNVVIRSLQYRADTGYLSFQVGSAITYDSDAEREYDECLLKAKAILEVLGTTIAS